MPAFEQEQQYYDEFFQRRSSDGAPKYPQPTEQTLWALHIARDEAKSFRHSYLGTEHLLLGLMQTPESSATLEKMGVSRRGLRNAIEFIIGISNANYVEPNEINLTPRSIKVIEFSIAEAIRLNSKLLRPRHMLLGLCREGEGIAAGVLESLGVDLAKVRSEVIQEMATEIVMQKAQIAAEAPKPESFPYQVSLEKLRATVEDPNLNEAQRGKLISLLNIFADFLPLQK